MHPLIPRAHALIDYLSFCTILNYMQYLVQVHLLMQTNYLQSEKSKQESLSTIHFVESGPSILDRIPGILSHDLQV